MLVKAYAKINLGLRVLKKRSDRFHDIETIFHRINLFDELTIEPAESSISVSSNNKALPSDERNLCWKAVELLRSEIGSSHGAMIRLKKNIPIGAGLGGGSSDAAAVLMALPRMWNIPVDPATLAGVALAVGSDVPFFLHGKSAYAEGRGERLNFVGLSLPYAILVVTPPLHVSTSWAYEQLSKQRGILSHRTPFYDGATCTIGTIPSLMENDFEGVVFPAYPEIREIKRKLLDHGGEYALLSGSGSSVFGLFPDEVSAQKAADFFSPKYLVSVTPPHFIPTL